MHKNSLLIFERYAKEYFKPGMKVLEIAPDKVPSSLSKMVGMDLEWDTLEMVTDSNQAYVPDGTYTHVTNNPYEYPIADGTYDVIVSSNVIEHVRKIWVWTKELSRILKKGGLLITINPFSWPFHEFPVDCWRIYPDGMRALYEDAGLEVLTSTCECLELGEGRELEKGIRIQDLKDDMRHVGYRRLQPGIGNPSSHFKTTLKNKMGWPISAAFDTLTIGRRP